MVDKGRTVAAGCGAAMNVKLSLRVNASSSCEGSLRHGHRVKMDQYKAEVG
jgi:hypothetical protein